MKSISDVLANQGLFADAGVAAVCSDARGRILWANEAFSQLYCGVGARESSGRFFHEFVAEPQAAERVEITRSTIAHGRRTIVYEIWKGLALDAVLTPMSPHDDAPDGCMLAVIRHAHGLEHAIETRPEATESDQVRVIRTKSWDLGPLAKLSRRELEILSLIGEGLSNAQVAELVHRTVKTVEFHRASISAKTGISSRVRLAQAAKRAGLYERLRGVGYRVPDIRALDKDPDPQPV